MAYSLGSNAYPTTPTCPTNCCVEPPPSPPRLRRTESASNYARPAAEDPGYDRWVLENNFSRIAAIEVKLVQLKTDLDIVRESNRIILARLGIPPRPITPITRSVAAPPLSMEENYGM